MKNNKEYEIGYKKPPKSTQFTKGKSGNPKGRRKTKTPEAQIFKTRKEDFAAMFCHLMEETVEYKEGGEVRRGPAIQVLLKRLIAKGMAGDNASIKAAFSIYQDIMNERAEFRDQVMQMFIETGRTDDETLAKIYDSL